ELGWPGIAVAEADGGQGLGIVELALIAEQAGYALAPTPLMSTWNAALFLSEGSDEQRERWLPGIASGETRGAAAFDPRTDDAIVPDADGAAVLVLSAGEDAARIVEPSAAKIEPLDLVDTTRRSFRGSADGGQPLPGAVRATAAAWSAAAEPASLPLASSLAKARASDAARDVTAAAIQVFGGIGFTWEHDVHFLLKRARVSAELLGTARQHRDRVASLVGLG